MLYNVHYVKLWRFMCNTGQLSSFGVPIVLKILVNWSKSDSPGKKGTRSKSSAKMQPTAQMSIAVPYWRAPNSNSGDLGKMNNIRGICMIHVIISKKITYTTWWPPDACKCELVMQMILLSQNLLVSVYPGDQQVNCLVLNPSNEQVIE